MFCLYTSSKFSRPQFEFSLKVKVMRSNSCFLLNYFFYFILSTLNSDYLLSTVINCLDPQYREETYQYVEEPQYQTTEYQAPFQEQKPPPPPLPSPRSPQRLQAKKSKSDFLLKKAFDKVANLFDSLFYNG